MRPLLHRRVHDRLAPTPRAAAAAAVPLAALLALAMVPAAAAQCDDPQHADVEVRADFPAAALLVGSGDFCKGQFVPDFTIRVFSAEFVNNPFLPPFFQGRAFNPGFNAADGAFPPLTPIAFTILDTLRKWDPVAMDFHTIPPERLTVQTANGSAITPLQPGTPVAGPPIAATDSFGSFHVHPTFALGEPKSAGVYLLTLEVTAASTGLPASDPIYIVFGQMADPAILAEAIAYAEDVLANPALPCPQDLTADGQVNSDDLGILLGAFGSSPDGDLDGNGITDSDDLGILLGAFGTPCP